MMVVDFIVKESRLCNEDNFLVWKEDASGEYSIRNAYKMLLQLLVKALACVQGLQLGVTMGFREVEVEGDARSVIKKIQSRWADKSKIQAYITDCQNLSDSFQTWVFLFGHRSKNEIAHLLATEGLRKEEQWNLDRGVLIFA
ncbi:hypothetical protein Golob_017832 [Gossypium lobatum]|uniref:RNase H type-1 domain-containing protein n=1 Tax=Gossypium lobatum TaxID=34289 RepID=A0A7J8M8F2_9ROSI|nr:hypothetical protein [Gossypium lobatum]